MPADGPRTMAELLIFLLEPSAAGAGDAGAGAPQPDLAWAALHVALSHPRAALPVLAAIIASTAADVANFSIAVSARLLSEDGAAFQLPPLSQQARERARAVFTRTLASHGDVAVDLARTLVQRALEAALFAGAGEHAPASAAAAAAFRRWLAMLLALASTRGAAAAVAEEAARACRSSFQRPGVASALRLLRQWHPRLDQDLPGAVVASPSLLSADFLRELAVAVVSLRAAASAAGEGGDDRAARDASAVLTTCLEVLRAVVADTRRALLPSLDAAAAATRAGGDAPVKGSILPAEGPAGAAGSGSAGNAPAGGAAFFRARHRTAAALAPPEVVAALAAEAAAAEGAEEGTAAAAARGPVEDLLVVGAFASACSGAPTGARQAAAVLRAVIDAGASTAATSAASLLACVRFTGPDPRAVACTEVLAAVAATPWRASAEAGPDRAAALLASTLRTLGVVARVAASMPRKRRAELVQAAAPLLAPAQPAPLPALCRAHALAARLAGGLPVPAAAPRLLRWLDAVAWGAAPASPLRHYAPRAVATLARGDATLAFALPARMRWLVAASPLQLQETAAAAGASGPHTPGLRRAQRLWAPLAATATAFVPTAATLARTAVAGNVLLRGSTPADTLHLAEVVASRCRGTRLSSVRGREGDHGALAAAEQGYGGPFGDLTADAMLAAHQRRGLSEEERAKHNEVQQWLAAAALRDAPAQTAAEGVAEPFAALCPRGKPAVAPAGEDGGRNGAAQASASGDGVSNGHAPGTSPAEDPAADSLIALGKGDEESFGPVTYAERSAGARSAQAVVQDAQRCYAAALATLCRPPWSGAAWSAAVQTSRALWSLFTPATGWPGRRRYAASLPHAHPVAWARKADNGVWTACAQNPVLPALLHDMCWAVRSAARAPEPQARAAQAVAEWRCLAPVLRALLAACVARWSQCADQARSTSSAPPASAPEPPRGRDTAPSPAGSEGGGGWKEVAPAPATDEAEGPNLLSSLTAAALRAATASRLLGRHGEALQTVVRADVPAVDVVEVLAAAWPVMAEEFAASCEQGSPTRAEAAQAAQAAQSGDGTEVDEVAIAEAQRDAEEEASPESSLDDALRVVATRNAEALAPMLVALDAQ